MVPNMPRPAAEELTAAFVQVLGQVHQAGEQFIAGNAGPISACWSQGADVSIFGAGGGQGLGWAQVEPSLVGGASQFSSGDGRGHIAVDILAMGTSGELGYTISIERGEAFMRGHEALRPVELRVTQIYRWEAGAWRLIHRHADALTARR